MKHNKFTLIQTKKYILALDFAKKLAQNTKSGFIRVQYGTFKDNHFPHERHREHKIHGRIKPPSTALDCKDMFSQDS